ncbi:AAA family ATPase [Succinimonas sp.]|uniref:AAA family ATPase n=1 Tax=Succinimonas sp. TaxID=1936151 RepID=UPI0038662586
MKLLPEGVSKFTEIIDNDLYFVDKTPYIAEFEKRKKFFLFFVRPRLFGKSVFLNMLETYYDIARKAQFEHYFGNTWIYRHVTPEQGKYQVIYLDFSIISSDMANIKSKFNLMIGYQITECAKKYRDLYDDDFIADIEGISTAKNKLDHFCAIANEKGYPVYLFIDEYDHIVRDILRAHVIKNPQILIK